MVMQDGNGDRNLDVVVRRLVQIEEKITALEKVVKTHLGTQTGAVTSNMPHPTMSAISRGDYTVTNGTTDRTYNADTVAVAELADIVYTLLEDLKSVRIIG